MYKERLNNSLSRVSNRAYYFHVSNYPIKRCTEIGDDVLLNPLRSSQCDGRGLCEPENARICVGPTVPHCLTAIANNITCRIQNLYIYRTQSKVQARYPYDVPDSRITREKWLIYPTYFVLRNVLHPVSIPDWPEPILSCGVGTVKEAEEQRKYLKEIRKVFDDNGITF